MTRATSSLASSSFLRLHLQPCLKDALLWLRVARFPSGPLRRLCRSFHFSQKSQRVVRTLQAEEIGWRTSQLDCPKVGGTRQAEHPCSKCSHLHQVGEKFLDSEVASEVPALLSTRRISGTGGIRVFSGSVTSTFDCDNTLGLPPEGRWQCRASLRWLWFS